ncbi:MAG: type I methionyl aminopeptidase [Rhodothermales bacterium]|nr:type I methionyl aminopeptidase [Rhodothermales bacterium]
MIQIKSESEIERMRASADLVGRALGQVAAHIAPGVTTAELDRIAEEFIARHGAVPAFKGYRVGKQVFPSTLCISVNDAVVHGIPGTRRLEEGDVVSIDCGVLLDGYYGDSAFTFAVGQIDSTARELCKTTYHALEAGLAQSVAGNRVGDISHAVQDYCERRGYGVVRDLVGHGIGRELHEDPQVPNVGRRGSGRKLKEGLVLCIEPMINVGGADVATGDDGWTVRTADGKPSAHYEHMVVVRRGKPEVLTTFRYIEEVLTPPYSLQQELQHG